VHDVSFAIRLPCRPSGASRGDRSQARHGPRCSRTGAWMRGLPCKPPGASRRDRGHRLSLAAVFPSAVAIALAVSAALAADPAAEPVLEGCLVSLIEEVKVPAREAGVIVQLAIREGAAVTEGEVLARIDDDQPQMEKRRAQAEHDQTLAKAESDVDVRYSQKAQGVAEMAFRKAEDSHVRIPGSVTEVERERLKLEWEKTGLQIEQAELERRLAALDATSKGVEVEAAEKAIERRVIRSPLTGEVEEVFPHTGEWLQPGDPLARVIRTDRLKVEGFVDATRFNPADVRDRPVTVEARLAGDRSERFQGRIVNVRPRMESGSYRVVAEVDNRQEEGEWLLRTGQFVTMAIHSGQPPLPPAERKRPVE
jgi:multidrug efflux pump subunit AcrA (membrane-fusion protein)